MAPGAGGREGRQAFRAALDGLGEILPPASEIMGLRQIEGKNEVVSIVEWKSEKVAGSQLSVLLRFKGDKIYEERFLSSASFMFISDSNTETARCRIGFPGLIGRADPRSHTTPQAGSRPVVPIRWRLQISGSPRITWAGL
jgi:hypothetical protein